MTTSVLERPEGLAGQAIRYVHVPSRLGDLLVAASDAGICRAGFDWDAAALQAAYPGARLLDADAQAREWAQQLAGLVEGDGARLPLDLRGSAFQLEVWAALQAIPVGETRSYAGIAQAIGRPSAVRAVGSACGANPVALAVPCHRVVRSDGGLGGYAWGLDRKRALLDLEMRHRL